MKKNHLLLLLLLCACLVQAQDTYCVDKDVLYISGFETDAYRLECCKLDIYYPGNKRGFSTTVWFHGGGMEEGNKFVPRELMDQGFAVVAINYRLSPKTKDPARIENAAGTVAWTFRNIEEYGSRKGRIFVSGYSTESCLALILAMDKRYMVVCGTDTDSVAAYLPVSGRTVTHFTARRERDLPNGTPIIDKFTPVNKAHKDTAPVVLITGDKNLEMADRYEENALLVSMLKNIGNWKVSLYEPQGFSRGQVLGPACYLVVNYMKRFR